MGKMQEWEKCKEKCNDCGKSLYKIKGDNSDYRVHARSLDCSVDDDWVTNILLGISERDCRK